jgi:hypothetical protein
MSQEIKKSFWGVIPATVRYDKKVVDGAKLLYSEISALCNEKGYCWATNEYFAVLYNTTTRTVSRWIASLEKAEHIVVPNGGKQRKIFLAQKMNFETDNLNEPVEADDQVPDAKKTIEKEDKLIRGKKFSNEDLFLAEHLLSKIIYNFPAFSNKKVNIEEWAEDIRKLREIDNATHEQIRFMITWVHGGEIEITGRPKRNFEPNEFWSKNILSARKLRKQWFDHLVPQLQSDLKKNIKKHASVQL